MNTAISKHFNHYQYIYLFMIILFGGGFFLGLTMKLLHQPMILFQTTYINHLITLDNIKNYMYLILFIYILLIFNSLHVLGVITFGAFIFLYGLHNGVYLYSLCSQFQHVFGFIVDLVFLLMQWGSVAILLVGCIEIAINIFAVTFVFKEAIRPSEILHQYLNYGFISVFIFFISIIFKTYMMKL